MHYLRSTLPPLRDPVWLLFLPPLLGRAWLLYRLNVFGSPVSLTIILLLILLFAALGWCSAALLARQAALSERPRERFLVMSTLGMLAAPLPLALLESSGWDINFSWITLLLPDLSTPWLLNFAHLCVLLVPLLALAFIIRSWLISLIDPKHPILTCLRRLTALPLAWGGAMFLLALTLYRLHAPSVLTHGALALAMLALPIFPAALFILPYLLTEWSEKRGQSLSPRIRVAFHIAMLVVIALYFLSQLYIYLSEALSRGITS
ncbi:hypothetical protein KSC_106920 [Ktedonobacter sp. SOSP1-52]|uniref:hypothetical protein n=1 Tax=Ktedonobacter sp. SOSP1-52 TaxID=2778366 RepID=UPI0019164C6F|nr:hypothetical protein [Ktedonobacter sp. SOSP1-52]GHO71800.1 hypothetical protein KSC_106920 [Ktedonobacter sp. SOSP1-52]